MAIESGMQPNQSEHLAHISKIVYDLQASRLRDDEESDYTIYAVDPQNLSPRKECDFDLEKCDPAFSGREKFSTSPNATALNLASVVQDH